jgi:hypothetical protein
MHGRELLVVVYALDLTPGTTFNFKNRGSPDERESLSCFAFIHPIMPLHLKSSHPLQQSERLLELAIVKVDACGHDLDAASEIVSAAGGTLIELHDAGFTVQVANRPELIDAMILRLSELVPISVNRSGGIPITGG